MTWLDDDDASLEASVLLEEEKLKPDDCGVTLLLENALRGVLLFGSGRSFGKRGKWFLGSSTLVLVVSGACFTPRFSSLSKPVSKERLSLSLALAMEGPSGARGEEVVFLISLASGWMNHITRRISALNARRRS